MTTNDERFRQILMNQEYRAAIKRLMITQGDDQLLALVKSGKNTTALISASMKISVQSAATRLEKLTLKGYLKREMVQQPSGGYEWRYQLCVG